MKGACCLAVAGLFVMASAAAESLPLERGYYVQRDTPCQKASNATISLYDGISVGSAHVECRKPVTRKRPDCSYAFVQKCRDLQGAEGKWETVRSSYAIQSRTEFIETTAFGTFPFRLCKQSELPDPWSTNDLSRYGIK